uniref:Uncharacterized protein n=1 Tax=Panagrolaimus sp. JU765 TaxID=591449 RepID=A0AC34RAU6_9BILA
MDEDKQKELEYAKKMLLRDVAVYNNLAYPTESSRPKVNLRFLSRTLDSARSHNRDKAGTSKDKSDVEDLTKNKPKEKEHKKKQKDKKERKRIKKEKILIPTNEFLYFHVYGM